jgi:hypothetical protein
MKDDPPGFSIEGARATFRPAGRVSFDDAVALIRRAIDAACASGTRELLVDTRGLTGFASPDTFERFLAAVQWAEGGAGRLRLSMVARPEMIDPDRFGVLVAANRGLTSNIFTGEDDARAWLDSRHTTR